MRNASRTDRLLRVSLTLLAIALLLSGDLRAQVRRGNQAVSDKPELVVQVGHAGGVNSVAVSPDGRLLATASADSTVILWDVATGRELRSFRGHAVTVYSVAFSANGRFLITGSADNTALLWDVVSGRLLHSFSGHSNAVRSVNFSRDGRYALTASEDNTARLWDTASGSVVHIFAGHSDMVFAAEFAPDGRSVLTGSRDSTARLWSTASGLEVKRFEAGGEPVTAVAFSPSGRAVVTVTAPGKNASGRALLWDVDSGQELRRYSQEPVSLLSISFSPDGRFLLIDRSLVEVETGKAVREFRWTSQGSRPSGGVSCGVFSRDGRFVVRGYGNGSALLFDANTGSEIRRFEGYANVVRVAVTSTKGNAILTGTNSDFAALWDTSAGRIVRLFPFEGSYEPVALSSDGLLAFVGQRVYAGASGDEMQQLPIDIGLTSLRSPVAVSADGRSVLARGSNKTAVLIDIPSGKVAQRFDGHTATLSSFQLSPDGRFAATGSDDRTVRLWDLSRGTELWRVEETEPVRGIAFSADSRVVLGFQRRVAQLIEVATGRTLHRLHDENQDVTSIQFSPDSRFAVIGREDMSSLVDIQSGATVRFFPGVAKAISRDGRFVLTDRANSALLFEMATGEQVWHLWGFPSGISSATFSQDGRWVLTGSDSSARLLNAATGKEVCRLISFRDGGWVVVDAEGRFDTNNLDDIKGLHWLMPDNPFEPLPVEIFMREYYEPRLLPRIIAGEKFKPVKSLGALNRVQPKVSIKEISSEPGGTVSVTVEVARASGEFKRNGTQVLVKTGVYDLRLFRDGQLIRYSPNVDGEIKTDPSTGKVAITFRDIKVPRRKDSTRVEFSSYAFNVDRVKSATDRKVFEISGLLPAKTRAYLVTVGVNAYEQRQFDLNFAANDARQIQKVMFDKLTKTGEYDEIIQVPLISDREVKSGSRIITEKTATKDNFRGVLNLLSGKQIDPELIKRIPNGEQLSAATPDDLVLISFSSHGFADATGTFYFVPYDTGLVTEKSITPELLDRCISSDELALWLRDVDAGEMVMIADACYSAAAVAVEDFKPGPMGSRGLGQLAYDKGMKILASTQADDVALESELIRQGLLTYALTHDGIEAGQADFKPKDQTITMSEWLAYGVKRVPQLYDEVKKGQVQTFGREAQQRVLVMVSAKDNSLVKTNTYQQPSLFDFGKKQRETLLAKGN